MFQKRIVFMLIVAIAGMLVGLILLDVIEKGKTTKLTSVANSMRTAMITLVACLEGGNLVNEPILSGGNQICPAGNPAALWPALQWNWTYDLGGSNFGTNCVISISPNDGGNNIACSCQNQACR